MADLKRCVDCKHSIVERGSPLEFMQCNAPQNRVESPLYHASFLRYSFCSTQRHGSSSKESCGHRGAWFQPKVKDLGTVTEVSRVALLESSKSPTSSFFNKFKSLFKGT